MESKHLIELVDISKDYNGDVALDHVNLYINDGEFLTLLGPSGCGKTTMLRIIAGFITPSTGMLRMNGVDIAKVPPHKRSTIRLHLNFSAAVRGFQKHPGVHSARRYTGISAAPTL